jgi:predicted AlkP superfamily phosphohydrolase/phosphomutase
MAIFRKPINTEKTRPLYLYVIIALLLIGGAVWWWHGRGPSANIPDTRVVILGFEGADPSLVRKYMAEKKLPNLAKLSRIGSFLDMETTIPAISPVSWSSFATGGNPGQHGIFDYITRNPRQPYLPSPDSLSRSTQDPVFLWDFIPYEGAELETGRKGTAFWKIASDHLIPSVLLNVPTTYPTDKSLFKSKQIAGFGVPDALETLGAYTFFSTNPKEVEETDSALGGKYVYLKDQHSWLTGEVYGPPSPIVKQRIRAVERQLEHIDREISELRKNRRGVARERARRKTLEERIETLRSDIAIKLPIRFRKIGQQLRVEFEGAQENLPLQEWGNPIPVKIKINRFLAIHAVCRFFVLSLEPETRVYMSPMDLHPYKAKLPLAEPKAFAKRMVREVGLYKTHGWKAETAGLAEGVLPEKAFLDDLRRTYKQREDMMKYAMSQKKWGLHICVFNAIDRVQSMFWHHQDPLHPLFDAGKSLTYERAIERFYIEMDKTVGYVMKNHVDENTALLVVSDSGVKGFYKAVHLNTWLVEKGFLHLSKQGRSGADISDLFGQGMNSFSNVDWKKSRAFSLGFGQIIVNLRGREKQGCVAPGEEYDQLLTEIKKELLTMEDPDTGEMIVGRVDVAGEIWSGDWFEAGKTLAPDLLVCFKPGYRVSWGTCLGGVHDKAVELNMEPWSGARAGLDPADIPGVLFCNRKITAMNPCIIDIAPTVLDLFELEVPESVEGHSLFSKGQ